MALKEMPDYDIHVRDEPLELLEVIESLMHTPEKENYPYLTLVEVLANSLKS